MDNYPQAIEQLLVDLFIEADSAPLSRTAVDLDATADPLCGAQEGWRFYCFEIGGFQKAFSGHSMSNVRPIRCLTAH